ncbi:MAG TPA: metallophosphoesterase [Actinomycetota bacterium]|nr:metallophosphoesterase [Actinomycetota bacterium]
MGLVLLLLITSACRPGEDSVTAGRERDAAESIPSSPPPPPPRFVFAVKGDWGAGTPEQAAITQQMCRSRQTTPFDVVVTTGDNFYRPDSLATQTNYYGPEACLISHPGHTWRAAWGNHDVAGDSTFRVLGAERYYRWSAGLLDFFVLDSNRAADPVQAEWLARQLEESRAAVKVAVFHHSPYTAGLHENNQDVRRLWVPLFERFGVRLVLTGHNHGYEHSVVNGIHYVVTGGGGATIYPCVGAETWLLKCLAVNHFLLVDAVGARLTVTALDSSGGVIDAFVIRG